MMGDLAKTESGWLVILLAALACSTPAPVENVGAAVRPDPTPGPEGAEKLDPKSLVFAGPGKLLVPPEFGQWRITARPRYFGPDNLFDLINGGADVFVDFGLVKMVTCDFGNSADPRLSLTVEIYDMGSARGAFGRLARYLSGLQDPSGAGAGLGEGLARRALFGGGDLLFCKGQYLVHLTVMDQDPRATLESIKAKGDRVLPLVARTIDERIGSAATSLAELDRFPSEGLIPRSGSWVPADLAGLPGLGPGFAARYADKEERWTLLVSEPLADQSAAAALVERVAPGCAPRCLLETAGRRIVGLVEQDCSPNQGQCAIPGVRRKKLVASLTRAWAK